MRIISLSATLAILATTGACGGAVARLGVGPTVYDDRDIGAEVHVTQGFRLGDTRAWQVFDITAGADISADAGVLQFGLGNDWGVAPVSSRLGYRFGYRLDYRRAFSENAIGLGPVFGMSYRLRRVRAATLALGVQMDCAYHLGLGDDADHDGRCRAAITLELINTWKPPSRMN